MGQDEFIGEEIFCIADIAKGLIPKDIGLIDAIARDICYNNAAGYFGIGLTRI